ncbi:MAG: hypothetical protein JWQ27_2095 [Ferruginibacter sp.]|nr:hypothetical protein [Ferruginibacter sp.]
MGGHIRTGKTGEQLAVAFFEAAGYDILHTNWRFKHWEIDIIARKAATIHFIEVKTRRSAKYGHPEEAVTTAKIRYLLNAAEQYLFLHPEKNLVQFDVLAITFNTNNQPDYFLLEDVYL